MQFERETFENGFSIEVFPLQTDLWRIRRSEQIAWLLQDQK